MAARIEFEIEWLPKFSKNSVATSKKNYTLTSNQKGNSKQKAINTVSSVGLKNMLDSYDIKYSTYYIRNFGRYLRIHDHKPIKKERKDARNNNQPK